MAYIKTSWIDDSPPPINASNLNKMEIGIENAHIAVASTDVALGSVVAYASTLNGNISANASDIAFNATAIADNVGALATQAAIGSSLVLTVTTQTAAIASNTAGVGTILPQVATITDDVTNLLATQGAQASQIDDLQASALGFVGDINDVLATRGAQATQIDELLASQAGLIATQAFHSSQIAEIGSAVAQTSAEVVGALADVNQAFGLGPIDYWNAVVPVGVTPSSGQPIAKYVQYIPVATVGAASAVREMTFDLLSNQAVASPSLEMSAAILADDGTVLTSAAATTVPIVATTAVVQTITLPLSDPSTILLPGEQYFLALSSDDRFKMSVLGLDSGGNAQAIARHNRGIVHELALPSGVDLSFYPTLPLNLSTTVPPDSYPILFVTE